MKNTTLALLVLLTIILGCKKENNSKEETRISDLKVSELIKSFQAKGISSYKSGEQLSLDSAIWYIQATANYNYGDASKETIHLFHDTSYIHISFNDNHVTLAEAWNKYEDVIDSLRITNQKIDSAEKQLMAVSVRAIDTIDSYLICEVASVFAVGVYFPYPCEFDPNGPGWEPYGGRDGYGGTCGDHQFPFRDATTEIQRKIMACKAVPAGNFYYESKISIDFLGLDYPVNPLPANPNYMGFYIYYSQNCYPGFDHCLSPQECNFYLNGTKHIIYDTPEEGGGAPSGYSLIDVKMSSDIITGRSSNFHRATVEYGILRIKQDPINNL